eukprot:GFYU01063436.1.p2 GENE.GFYU01063436.1~~GFYU01063436.1.p2  ORF type:complete len:102 (+),score=11.04 GFYU01063436.1:145-450(+)
MCVVDVVTVPLCSELCSCQRCRRPKTLECVRVDMCGDSGEDACLGAGADSGALPSGDTMYAASSDIGQRHTRRCSRVLSGIGRCTPALTVLCALYVSVCSV